MAPGAQPPGRCGVQWRAARGPETSWGLRRSYRLLGPQVCLTRGFVGFFSFFKRALLRYNAHAIKFTDLTRPVQWFLVCVVCNSATVHFRTLPSPRKEN